MDQSLLRLMEELVDSIEAREAADPDAPAWEAAIRVARLEEELASRLRTDPARTLHRGERRRAAAGAEALAATT